MNWGLGHASRCIPIIKELIALGNNPIIASDGGALILLQKEFPHLKCYSLPPYDIRYGRKSMLISIAIQLPKIAKAIYQEQKAITQIVKKENIDIIISDNRYGCKSSQCYNIFMTHQLNIKIPFPLFENIVNWINHRFIKIFDTCWVPDFQEEPSLGGELSRKTQLKNVKYIGPISRMINYQTPIKYDLIVVLSGPEPQRSYLEEIILKQVQNLPYKCLLVQGITSEDKHEVINDQLEIRSFLTSQDLNKAMLSSKIIICRSGYSSIMDLARLEKRAILIPTPGQTEQEYLADRLHKQGVFYRQTQKNINIEEAIKKNKAFSGVKNQLNQHILNEELQHILSNIL